MGLDQYGFARKGEETVEVACWRKHANLQGWMERLWTTRTGGSGSDFNCKELVLTGDDLNQLESEYKTLARSTGFFWGESHPEDDQLTKSFIAEAKKYMNDGYEVYYYCWW
jgi:hypothetical protein